MAIQTFNDIIKDGDCDDMVITIDDVDYFGFNAGTRVDRSTVPDGWYVYDMREDDDGNICKLKNGYIMVNYFGTFCTKDKLPLDEGKSLFIGDEEEFYYSFC